MTTAYEALLQEKNKSTNAPIHLIIVEITEAVFDVALEGSTTTDVILSARMQAEWDAHGYGGYDTGFNTCITFESGPNIGTCRVIESGYMSGNVLTLGTPLDYTPNGDKIRVARCLFLAQWDTGINFYIPDKSSQPSVAQLYVPFPMKIEPVGTTTTGELLSMTASVSNVNRLFGNAIQTAGGLRNSRVTHIFTYLSLLDQGKECCIVNTMYIDSVTITAQDVTFILESKLNVININLPFCNYNRDSCRWVFDSEECGWSTYSNTVNTDTYREAKTTSCDHTLRGPNGCVAHGNNRRYGGFPSLIGKG